jgi:tricorn protease
MPAIRPAVGRAASIALVFLAALAAVPLSAAESVKPSAQMLRYPDVSADRIAFLYADDLWTVPREGGLATPLASPPGEETRPRFSPDGKTLAFVGNYDGNADIYTVPIDGGVPKRVTWHPATENLNEWTSDGRLIFAAGQMGTYPRTNELWTVDARGGLPVKLPVPYGGNATIHGDWLAYTLHAVDHRTWKRYRGGMAMDVWLYNLKTNESKRVTDWAGTDSLPMWAGDDLVYVSDDGPSHKLNLWKYERATGTRTQLTQYADFDVKWPAMGPGSAGKGEVVFQHGADLVLFDVATGQAHTVDVRIPGARPALRAQTFEAGKLAANESLSPSGKRVLLEARGEIWSVPVEHGSARNLTRSAGAADRDPVWSPDGDWIAWFSDASGEYELYVAKADGTSEPRKVTSGADRFLSRPVFSPDSKKIAFWDLAGALQLADVATGKLTRVDADPWAPFPPPRVAWSADSAWIAYARAGENILNAIWLYDVKAGKATQVTSGRFNDNWPVFDPKGKFLYFVSIRDFTAPAYEDIGTTFVYTEAGHLYAVPLTKKEKSPIALKNDEEGDDEKKGDDGDDDKKNGEDKKDGEDKKGGGDKKDKDAEAKEKEKPKPVKIDLDGFEARAVLLPVPRGNFADLAVTDEGKLVYTRAPRSGSDGKGKIEIYDFDPKKPEKEVLTVVDGVDTFRISEDGKKLLVRKDQDLFTVDAQDDQKLEKQIALGELKVTVEDPRAEWRQMFHEAWRLERDFFYQENMHGVDWNAMRDQYGALVEEAASRSDLAYIIKELISELNIGHAYYSDDGPPGVPQVPIGMPGADFALENGAYRIAKIYGGAPWDADARGPLEEPGLDVKVGDYLLAVNGRPVDVSKAPWAAFQGLADKTVTLTVSSKSTLDATARRIVVKLAKNESALRFRSWVEANRAYVEKQSGGKIGYVYVPNTGIDGQNELFRQFYGQLEAQALIVDERWNGGGQIPNRFVELLDRPAANYWARRDGKDWPWPIDSQQGPKAMLINGLAGSGGDYFPFYFKRRGLGPLIGTRTWGGLVGISGNPNLIDGASVTVPTFGFYETDGTWGIEGFGVAPDIEVIDDPAKMKGGKDIQLDAAIDYLAQELEKNPYRKPQRPAPPQRGGMEDRPEDH